ncbi:uncharacterized protein [Ptychodera flava]|uniref:uncharacterized protein n=1 Tax=Ptychodera flava TaxID=63121 RepID=UPI00396A5E52
MMELNSQNYRALERNEVAEKLTAFKMRLAKGTQVAIKMTYLMKHVLEGKWTNYEFVVDSRKELEDISIIGRPSKEYDLGISNVVIYSSDEDHLRYLLRLPGIIDWANPRLEIVPNCAEIEPILREIIIENGYSFKDSTMADIMVLENVDCLRERSRNIRLPEDMTLSAVRQEQHIEEISRAWPFGDPTCSPEYIRYMKTQILNLPNICVQKNDELIAWSLQQFHGAIGNTFVKPEYRGQGLGSLVTTELAKKVLANGMAAYIECESGDDVSKNMHIGVGFKYIPTSTQVYLTSYKCPAHTN